MARDGQQDGDGHHFVQAQCGGCKEAEQVVFGVGAAIGRCGKQFRDQRGWRREALLEIALVGMDLRSELTVLGRYPITVNRSSCCGPPHALPQGLSERLDAAYAALVDELGGWLTAWAPSVSAEVGKTLAALATNGLLGDRLATNVFRGQTRAVADDELLAEWTTVLYLRVQSLVGSGTRLVPRTTAVGSAISEPWRSPVGGRPGLR